MKVIFSIFHPFTSKERDSFFFKCEKKGTMKNKDKEKVQKQQSFNENPLIFSIVRVQVPLSPKEVRKRKAKEKQKTMFLKKLCFLL